MRVDPITRLMKVNSSVKRMAAHTAELIDMPKHPITQQLKSEIIETYATVKAIERSIPSDKTLSREDIYLIGKIIGRLEATYSILVKAR